MESFSIEIICKNSKNIVLDNQNRHPSSKGKIFKKYRKKCFSKTKSENNQFILSST